MPHAVCRVGIPGFPAVVAADNVPPFTAWLSLKVPFPDLGGKGALGDAF